MTSAAAATAGDVTTVICARNAAPTIARAVSAARRQGGPVVVVDDASNDGTGELARADGGVRVVRIDVHRPLGHARNVGVAAVETPWLQWLDADDEVLPGRAAALRRAAVAGGWDAAWDAADLHDGPTGAWRNRLPMPALMQVPSGAVRLFERNHVPGPAWPLVRTAFARRLGYDSQLPTADDLDFLLRAVVAGAPLGFVDSCGYRQFAYPSSLSRDRHHQRAWVRVVLEKHAYDDVRARYLAAGWPARVAEWAMVTMATFRDDWAEALVRLEAASPVDAPDGVLEPDGPWPFPERWRRAFHRGTLLLLQGDDAGAAIELARAEALRPSAEAANNLGVALARRGDGAAAECFARALSRCAAYADARANLAAGAPGRITLLPLRASAARSDYT